MRYWAAILVLAAILIVGGCMRANPVYYVCAGTKTPHGQQPQPVQHVGMEVQVYPMLNRLIFRPDEVGLMTVDQSTLYKVVDDSGAALSLDTFNHSYRGQFDRINRHLDVFTGEQTIEGEYDLYCSETKLAPV